MTVVTEFRTDVDNMMYQYVQTEIDLAAFEAWFIDRWPDVDRALLADLCGVFERDEMPWQDMAEAFAQIIRK